MHLFPEPADQQRHVPTDTGRRSPTDTFLSATYPPPVAACASEVPSRVIDTVMAAVGKSDPAYAQGGASSTSVNFTLHGTDDGREYIMYFFAGGGYGAYDGGDGLSNACATISMSKVPPIELLEEWYPITFERYEFRGGSGGDGEFRGGLGAQYLIRVDGEARPGIVPRRPRQVPAEGNAGRTRRRDDHDPHPADGRRDLHAGARVQGPGRPAAPRRPHLRDRCPAAADSATRRSAAHRPASWTSVRASSPRRSASTTSGIGGHRDPSTSITPSCW